MKKTVICTLTFIFINSFFSACCLSTSCGCGAVEGYSYKIENYTLSSLEYISGGSDTNPYDNPVASPNSSIAHNNIVFVFVPTTTSVSLLQKERKYLPGLLYACSPSEDPSQKILNIVITSNDDYHIENRTYLAGENLATLFNINTFSNEPIADYLSSGNTYAYNWPFYISLTKGPITKSTHQFTFSFEFSDGSTLPVSADSFEIF